MASSVKKLIIMCYYGNVQDTKVPVKSADDNTPSDVPSEMSADVSSTINEETRKEPPVESVANNEDSAPVDSGSKESTIDEGAENLKKDDGKKGGGISSQAELLTENKESNKTVLETQVEEVKEQPSSDVATQTEEITPAEPAPTLEEVVENNNTKVVIQEWTLCRMRDAQDFIPCLDNAKAIKKLRSRKHYQHRERHCPSENDLPKCLVPLPKDYKTSIRWPKSRDQVSPQICLPIFHLWCKGKRVLNGQYLSFVMIVSLHFRGRIFLDLCM